MKKIFLVIAAVLILGTAPVWAQASASDTKSSSNGELVQPNRVVRPDASQQVFTLGVGTGVDFAGANWNPSYSLGAGGSVFAGYQWDKTFSIQADVENWALSGGGVSVDNPRFLFLVKYTFANPGFQPYLLAGPGVDLQFATPSGQSTFNLDALAGAGVQFGLGSVDHLFIEARYNLTLTSGSTLQDVPVLIGLWHQL